MKINTAISASANLFALVNSDNALTLNATKVTPGVPAPRTPGADPSNTTLTFTAIADQGYFGTVDVTYTRLGMSSGVTTPIFDFLTDGDTTNASLLAAAAASLGLIASEIQITGTLPAADGDTTTVSLSAKAGSLLYIGSQDLNLEWPADAIDLAEAVAVTQLNGFEPA